MAENIKLGKREIIIGLSIVVLGFFFILFGITGVRTVVGFVLLFFVPFFVILNNFNLELEEKILFSFFIGIGFFSTLTYWLGFLVGSLRLSIIIVFLIVVAAGIVINVIKKKKS